MEKNYLSGHIVKLFYSPFSSASVCDKYIILELDIWMSYQLVTTLVCLHSYHTVGIHRTNVTINVVKC